MSLLPKAPFGRTGHQSTRALFGAAAFAGVDQATADRTMKLVAERGVNHIDTAASYGHAEARLGPWLCRNRDSVFLATKTEKRTYAQAKAEFQASLQKMQVANVDLWQMHILVDEQEWETAMGPNGALEAFIEAREAGLVKWLGVTGHGLNVAKMHMRSLERFDFDTVLLPWNWPMAQNAEYVADFMKLYEICREKNVAFQLIKTVCHRPWNDGETHSRDTWYKPLEDPEDLLADLERALLHV